jgi:hypothetical protein
MDMEVIGGVDAAGSAAGADQRVDASDKDDQDVILIACVCGCVRLIVYLIAELVAHGAGCMPDCIHVFTIVVGIVAWLYGCICMSASLIVVG